MSSWSSAQFSYHFHQLSQPFHHNVTPSPLNHPHWVHWNSNFALSLNLPEQSNTEMLNAFSGIALPEAFKPIAMKYAGHQFGYYNPDLGDGRGLLMAEIKANDGHRYDIHVKGAGLTPFLVKVMGVPFYAQVSESTYVLKPYIISAFQQHERWGSLTATRRFTVKRPKRGRFVFA